VYNVHAAKSVSKKRWRSAMILGQLFRAKPVQQCDLIFAFIRITRWNARFRIGVWRTPGNFLFSRFWQRIKKPMPRWTIKAMAEMAGWGIFSWRLTLHRKSLDVRAKQRLFYLACPFPSRCVGAVSPHVISIVMCLSLYPTIATIATILADSNPNVEQMQSRHFLPLQQFCSRRQKSLLPCRQILSKLFLVRKAYLLNNATHNKSSNACLFSFPYFNLLRFIQHFPLFSS